MKIYFFDSGMRYIGCRELSNGEPMPKNATTEPVTLFDGQQAYLYNGTWVISDIPPMPEASPALPTLDERLEAVEMAILDIYLGGAL